MESSDWSDAEVEQLRALVNEMTIAQIANRLGRTYNAVALKISRLGIGTNWGNRQVKKIPKGIKYSKPKITEYLQLLEQEPMSLNKFAKEHGLKTDNLTNAIRRFYPEWMDAYGSENAVRPKTKCPYCGDEFWPLTHKQIFCTKKCADDNRSDQSYFGGRRRETIGWADGICQLCNQHTPKGLSSHHIRGKENDPDNAHLIALCSGCHNIVTLVAGRRFAATVESWEVLIQLVLLRKNGHDPAYKGVFTKVQILPVLAEK